MMTRVDVPSAADNVSCISHTRAIGWTFFFFFFLLWGETQGWAHLAVASYHQSHGDYDQRAVAGASFVADTRAFHLPSGPCDTHRVSPLFFFFWLCPNEKKSVHVFFLIFFILRTCHGSIQS